MPHLTLAANETAFTELFNNVRDTLVRSTGGSGSFGPFTASYTAGVRVEGGEIDLRTSPDRVVLNELDVVMDPLTLDLDIDIPEACIGGFCLFWVPFFGCQIRAPRICVFSADPDLRISLDLSDIFTAEIFRGLRCRCPLFSQPRPGGTHRSRG